LDSPPAPELENILSLISGIFGTQAALIALFGDKRIWVMAGRNFAVGAAARWGRDRGCSARRWPRRALLPLLCRQSRAGARAAGQGAL
jgi:hypothetical protein